jgi:N-acetyl-gamma-glutamyl-phosphate reductase
MQGTSRPRVRAAIIGGTGYGGAELIRLLLSHPGVELAGSPASTASASRSRRSTAT